MAELTNTPTPNSNSVADHVQKLRTLASAHLEEIDEERKQEIISEAKRIAELEHYTKRPRNKQSRSPVSSTSNSSAQTSRMRSAQDVLARLQWDEDFDITQFKVGYLERFEGIKENSASEWIQNREVTEEEWIPLHRIKYFKRGEEVVWDREKRIDLIFGSGGSIGTDEGEHDGGVVVV
jgi:uncharacterized protein (UPF0248 family)